MRIMSRWQWRWIKTLSAASESTLARDRIFVGSTTNDFYAFEPYTAPSRDVALRWRCGWCDGDRSLVFVASLDNSFVPQPRKRNQ